MADTRRAPVMSILVLSEDSGQDTVEVMCALGKKMLQLIVPGCHTHRIEFEPANDDARRAMQANRWKARGGRQLRVRVVQSIATKIAEERGFVFFHTDGDRTWQDRATAENPRKFETLIREGVRAILRGGLHRRAPMSEKDAEALLTRLLAVIPYYSIEAWLYQNTTVAIRLCNKHHSGRDVARFEHWRNHRHELDEVERPKDAVCLGSQHNRELARERYPAGEVYRANRSMAAAVDAMLRCTDLASALEETMS